MECVTIRGQALSPAPGEAGESGSERRRWAQREEARAGDEPEQKARAAPPSFVFITRLCKPCLALESQLTTFSLGACRPLVSVTYA